MQTVRVFFLGALAAVLFGQPDIRALAADIAPTHAESASTACPAGLVVAGTPLVLTLDEGLSSATSKLGDAFHVTVLHDVRVNGVLAVPQGTHGTGQITFVSKRGGMGKAGILALSLGHIDLGGKAFALDGHYEEDGTKRHNTAGAMWFLVGVGAVLVRGGEAVIPMGRELKARTGQAICPPLAPPVDPAIAADTPPVPVF